ncbi:nitric oxide-sensing protein NosP [Propionivibrio soli]|uniref:nitric oxide-sensing protein NosP n=1 Tax=Propionivibrio soli TaxID=2976531 RepID=UPI0021E82D7E|nr:nitric oxide-sensing protein NosP [Propionivibrio soli]
MTIDDKRDGVPPRQFVRTGHSLASDARQAVREFHAAVAQDECELVVFFCSSHYDLDALASEMKLRFPGVRVVGCTTAGEIGPSGYRDHSLSGISFPTGSFKAAVGLFEGLQDFSIAEGQAFARTLLLQIENTSAAPDVANVFAFLMVDGLSVREEPVVHTFQTALARIPLIGGSAADDLEFKRTRVYHGDRFHDDSAVLVLISTPFPFRVFKTQHFVSSKERLVVTEADPSRRLVKEVNGLPAAEEYARVIGVPKENLGAFNFASSPVVVILDGTDYVRSIQRANPDGSLTFFCAIEEGLVLRVAHGVDLLDNLNRTFAGLVQEIGPPQAVLACDCVLRNIEIAQSGLKSEVSRLFDEHHVVGFSTYGEQFRGVHVNQTLTGIALGTRGSDDA